MVPDVADCARFFDHLVDLVPARFYYDEYDKVNPRHLAKPEREIFKADVRNKAKVAKRAKFDSDRVVTTLEVQRRRAQAAKNQSHTNDTCGEAPSDSGRMSAGPSASQPNGAPSAPTGFSLRLPNAALSRQQLLDRLHKKVEEARQRRSVSTAAKAKEWRQNALQGNVAATQQKLAGAKRKGGAGGETAAGSDTPVGGKYGKPQGQQPAKKVRRDDHGASSGGEEQLDFKFVRIEADDGGPHGKHTQGKKLPKQVLLKQAEAKKAELEALEDTEEGKAKAQQAAWKAAMARAAGEKVLDDPKLLRRSLKRDNKLREKHSKAWQERAAAQQESQATRQAKRNENLAVRRQTKLDNKKAKRDKKLLRPGFEGRKEGFITPGGGGAK